VQEMQEKKIRPKHKLFGVHRRLCASSGSARALQPSSSTTTQSSTSSLTRMEGRTASETRSSSSR
jgi:hypothetical protein